MSRNLLARLRRKFLLEPAGYGRPVDQSAVDGEYKSGAWAHFHQLPELPRQSVIVGYVSELYKNPSILDLGCGSGRLAQLFQPHPFRRYLGVDLSPEGIRMARDLDLQRCEFTEGNFETWQPSEKFDVIMFSECIGYANDPGALVAAFIPWLEPKGTVVISHFRFGHWQAHWRRVEQHLETFEATTVANAKGQTWDIRLLRPRTTA
ncbi:class I SAM-dependent methyltransferase [Oleiharenicola lentus]|uniref:class I SAM-dependent methyltransferase n=1 Tax=Oleiharenicola lentus TaxID=2508720 RepID=UPI003F680326